MSFRVKIISLILLVSIIPYLFIMLYTGNTLRDKYFENTTKELKTQLTLNVDRIDQYIITLQRDMKFISKLDVMNDIFSKDIDRRISNLLKEKKVELGIYGDFHLLDLNNNIIASSNPENIFKKFDKKTLFNIKVKSSFNDKVIGKLVFDFPLKNLKKFFKNTDEQYYYVVSNNKILFKPKGFNNIIKADKSLESIPSISIVLEKNQEIFLNSIKRYESLFILALIIGMVIIGIVAYFLINKIINPVLHLSQHVEEITKTQDYKQSIEVEGRDEISKLAKAFNQMLLGIDSALEDNKILNHEIEATQKEVVFTMGAIGESRSKETGNHVKRVAEYSKLLALLYGLSESESEMIKQASPMHDIGKIAIPDAVLNKPGRFNDEERKIMDTHAELGYEMLKVSNRPLLKAAATVAYEHHEKWDGSGYPRGMSGEDIHIYGRITALADVFDALGSDRVYKKAWDDERIFTLFREERAKHFDPTLIDVFFENLEKFLAIRDKFKDA